MNKSDSVVFRSSDSPFSVRLIPEIITMLILAIVLAFSYNAYRPDSLSLIRVAPKTVAIPDSELFSQKNPVVVPPIATDTVIDSATQKKIPVIAPLQKRARENPDSVRKLLARHDTTYSVISLDQLKRLMADHRGVIIDARNEDEFAKGHIPGAHNIPYDHFDKYFDAMMQIPQDTIVIVYCNGLDCHLGKGLCDLMVGMAFKHVYLYDEGWDGWEKAKMPVEKSNGK